MASSALRRLQWRQATPPSDAARPPSAAASTSHPARQLLTDACTCRCLRRHRGRQLSHPHKQQQPGAESAGAGAGGPHIFLQVPPSSSRPDAVPQPALLIRVCLEGDALKTRNALLAALLAKLKAAAAARGGDGGAKEPHEPEEGERHKLLASSSSKARLEEETRRQGQGGPFTITVLGNPEWIVLDDDDAVALGSLAIKAGEGAAVVVRVSDKRE